MWVEPAAQVRAVSGHGRLGGVVDGVSMFYGGVLRCSMYLATPWVKVEYAFRGENCLHG